mmetsp:Transcript_18729/g.54072  ORF Transcript_18729/g.54072 Transcript_18729/m.54072 type:complete len:98 (-) Transcript_18729:1543-1836(-)
MITVKIAKYSHTTFLSLPCRKDILETLFVSRWPNFDHQLSIQGQCMDQESLKKLANCVTLNRDIFCIWKKECYQGRQFSSLLQSTGSLFMGVYLQAW